MTYRIELREPVLDEVRRNLAEQLDGAVADLLAPEGPDAAAVHDARKRIKKTRSLLRLARAQLGPGVIRVAQAELREVATAIAAQRDADARVETVDRLLRAARRSGDERGSDGGDRTEGRDGSDGAEALGALERLRARAAERADAERTEGSLDRATVAAIAHRLQRTRDWLVRVGSQADGWDALEPGLRRQYARGRRALADLGDHPTDDELHEWRKRVKDLWYHERLLRRLWPKAQKPYVHAASELADLLGDDHDLGVLTGFVAADDGLDDADRAAIAAVTAAERARLQARARVLGARLYADAPAAWAARHRAWWEATKQASPVGAA